MFARAKQQIDVRPGTFDDYERIAALETAHGLRSKPPDEWCRLWTDNPCYKELGPTWPIGWVLYDRDRIVGSWGNIPLPYVFRGEKLLVSSGRGWVVEDQYRGYAPLLADQYFSQRSVDVFLNNTVNAKASEAFQSFGSLRVPVGDWTTAVFTITRYRGFAESALRVKKIAQPRLLSCPLGMALSLKALLPGKSIPKSKIDVALTYDFAQQFDGFWTALQQCDPTFMAVRSREVLRWHFRAAIESNGLWVMTAGVKGSMQAYAVFQRCDEPLHGLKRMRVIDFQAIDRHDEYCAAFMARAHHECRAKGIHVLEQLCCGLERTRVFEGSAAYRRRLPSWSFFYLANTPELTKELSKPEAWAPSSYDGDASL